MLQVMSIYSHKVECYNDSYGTILSFHTQLLVLKPHTVLLIREKVAKQIAEMKHNYC